MVPERLEALSAIEISDAVYFFREVQGFELIFRLRVDNHAMGIYRSTEHPGWYVLAFRGTEELADWATNLNTWPSWKQAHRGYRKGWLSMRAAVLAWFEGVEIKHLTLCGHSMGGALAQLALLDIPRRPTHLITFGSTKAVSPSLASAIASKADKGMRFVFGGDIAPFFPFAHLRHPHPAIQLGPPRTWWRMLLCFWHHHPRRYIAALGEGEEPAEA